MCSTRYCVIKVFTFNFLKCVKNKKVETIVGLQQRVLCFSEAVSNTHMSTEHCWEIVGYETHTHNPHMAYFWKFSISQTCPLLYKFCMYLSLQMFTHCVLS